MFTNSFCVAISLTFSHWMKVHFLSFPSYHILSMVTHPSGVTVAIIGIGTSDHGGSCEEHDVCGSVTYDIVIRLQKLHVIIESTEESAIGTFWVTNGVDCCLVGFLQCYFVPHWKKCEGRFAFQKQLG